MPPKRQHRTQAQRASQQFGVGALSLDKGPLLAPPQQPLAPPPTATLHHNPAPPYLDNFPNFPVGGFSSSSSVASSPHPGSESPDLALLGASLPQLQPPSEPSSEPETPMSTTLGDKTFNAKAEMPTWMQEVTSGFAKEVSGLMQDMEELRKQKQALQLEIATLMGTLSQYSPGGQFAPRWGQSITPEPPASEPESLTEPGPGALVPSSGPAKPGWRTIRPAQPTRIRSKVRIQSSTPTPPPAPKVTMPALPAPSPRPEPVKRPSWSTWQPANVRSLPMKAPVPAPPPAVPTLFGE